MRAVSGSHASARFQRNRRDTGTPAQAGRRTVQRAHPIRENVGIAERKNAWAFAYAGIKALQSDVDHAQRFDGNACAADHTELSIESPSTRMLRSLLKSLWSRRDSAAKIGKPVAAGCTCRIGRAFQTAVLCGLLDRRAAGAGGHGKEPPAARRAPIACRASHPAAHRALPGLATTGSRPRRRARPALRAAFSRAACDARSCIRVPCRPAGRKTSTTSMCASNRERLIT